MPEHLSPEITASRRTVPASERMLDSTEVVVRLDQPMAAAVRHLEQRDGAVRVEEVRAAWRNRGDAGSVAQGPLSEAAALRHRAARKHGRQRLIALRAAPAIFSLPLFFGRLSVPLLIKGTTVGRTSPRADHGRWLANSDSPRVQQIAGPLEGYRLGAADVPVRIFDLTSPRLSRGIERRHAEAATVSACRLTCPARAGRSSSCDTLHIAGHNAVAVNFIRLDEDTRSRIGRAIERQSDWPAEDDATAIDGEANDD